MADMLAEPVDVEVLALLKELYLFKGISEEDLVKISRRFERISLEKDDLLFKQKDHSESFYIILEGSIWLERQVSRNNSEVIGKLVRGDYLGEMGLLRKRPRSATAKANEKSIVLRMTRDQFRWLITMYPQVEKLLQVTIRSYEIASRKAFDWIDQEEPVHIIARKHVSLLIFALFFPTVVFLASAGLFVLGEYIHSGILVSGSVLLMIGAGLWGGWMWIDWANDYYIITDRRVVWVEEIPLLYDSRREAPLGQVVSVDIASAFWQRLLGTGDVVIRTIRGGFTMRNIGQPQMFKGPILEYKERYQKQVTVLTSREKDQRMVSRLRPQPAPPIAQPAPATPASKPTPASPGRKQARPAQLTASSSESHGPFVHLFKMRYEENGVVTYRKHWFLLLRRVGIYLAVLFLLLLFLAVRLLGFFTLVSVSSILLITGAFIFLTSPFWLYQYLDWRNDQYQVTDKNIFDLEKKPLGREVKKSAALENILGIENRREGILGLILNFGTVLINVGDITFNFIGVHDPPGVQQEIFEKYYKRKAQLEAEEQKKKDEDILDWIERYDRKCGKQENEPGIP